MRRNRIKKGKHDHKIASAIFLEKYGRMQRILPGFKGSPALGVVQRRNAGRSRRKISPPAAGLFSWTEAGLSVLHDHKIASAIFLEKYGRMQRILPGLKGPPALGVVQRRNAGPLQAEDFASGGRLAQPDRGRAENPERKNAAFRMVTENRAGKTLPDFSGHCLEN